MKKELVHSDFKLKYNPSKHGSFQKLHLSAKENDTSSSSKKSFNTERDVSYSIPTTSNPRMTSATVIETEYSKGITITDSLLRFYAPPESKLIFKVIGFKVIPGYAFMGVIKVPVNLEDGCVLGTNCDLRKLLHNKPNEPDVQSIGRSTCLIFEGLHDNLIFERSEGSCVNVSSYTSTSVVMDGVCDLLWNQMKQVNLASKCFQDKLRATYDSADFQSCLDNAMKGTKWIEVLLYSCIGNIAKPVTAGIKMIHSFNSLPFEDQIILLKEGNIGVGVLLVVSSYDSTVDCVVSTAFDRALILYSSLDTWKAKPWTLEIFTATREAIQFIPSYLRKDPFVISLLCCIFFFQERAGLSGNVSINHERDKFMQLLDNYILAKIKYGHWNEDQSQVWNQVHRLLAYLLSVNDVYRRFTKSSELHLVPK